MMDFKWCKILKKLAGGGGLSLPWISKIYMVHVVQCNKRVLVFSVGELGSEAPPYHKIGKATSPAQLPNLILSICSIVRP